MANYRIYRWQAVDRQGLACQGESLLRGISQLHNLLLSEGKVLISLKARGHYRPRDWHPQQHILLFQQIALLLRAGLPLVDGLQLLADAHPLKIWRLLLQQLRQQIMRGTPFSDGLAAWPDIFPPLCLAMVRAGEETGQLDRCCSQLAHQQQQQLHYRKQFLKALRYPLFILLLTLSITLGMLLWVLPAFEEIYRSANTPLPAFTRRLISLSQVATNTLPVILLLMALLLAGGFGLYRYHPRGQLLQQNLLFRLPLAGRLWQAITLARLFSLLALTQGAGLPLYEGLHTASGLATGRFWHQQLSALQSYIRQGQSLSTGMAQQPGFTPLCVMLTRCGEQSGQLEVLFQHLANWYDAEAQHLTARISSSIEPLMLLITGSLTAMMVVALYLPMFNLGNALI